MKIDVATITEEPFLVKEDIAASAWDMDSLDIQFVDNVHLEGSFTRIDKELMVAVCVRANRKINCSRCLRQVEKLVEYEFNLDYALDQLGEFLDIDPDIREEILLNFPLKVLCKPDCKGICSGCGVDLNLEMCKCTKKNEANFMAHVIADTLEKRNLKTKDQNK